MKSPSPISFIFAAMLLAGSASGFDAGAQTTTTNPGGPGSSTGDTGVSGAIQQKLLLTPADVPPMIELYTLPDDATASVPAAKLYKYTMVENKVVLVDPTKMRVIDVIGPPPSH